MLTEIVNKIYHVKCREARHGGTQLLCQHWGGRNRSHDLGPHSKYQDSQGCIVRLSLKISEGKMRVGLVGNSVLI